MSKRKKMKKRHKKATRRESGGSYYLVSYLILFQLSKILDGANHLRSVRVLIVVPGNNLNE